MKTQISPREWEALSAYLDGQLGPNERARLEKHLRSSADLRAALEELRRTRALLRSQPRLKSPRNFTLTPEMVGKVASHGDYRRSPSSLFPAFSLASALAGLLFIVILVTDLLNLGPAAQPMVAAPAAKEVVVTQEVALFAERQAEPETADVQATEAPAEAPAAASAAQSEAVLPTGTPRAVGEQPALSNGMASPELVTGTPSALPTTSPAEALPIPTAAEPEMQQALAPTINPPASLEVSGQTEAADMASPAEGGETTSPMGFWTEWRVLEIALAVIALATGLTAFLLRRGASL